MNNELYVEVIEYIKKNKYLLRRIEELLGEDCLTGLSNISYDDAMDIFSYDNVKLILSKIYLMVRKEHLNKSLVDILEKNVKNKNPNIAYSLDVIEKFKKNKNVKLNNIVDVIAKARGEEQAERAKDAALKIGNLKKFNCIEVLNLIGSAKDETHASAIAEVATNNQVLRSEKPFDCIREIASCESEKSEYISEELTNDNFFKRKDFLELLRAIKKGAAFDNYVYACKTANDDNVLRKKDALEIVRTVAKASRPYFTMLISTNADVLGCDDYLDIIKKVSQYKHEYQIWKAVDVMTCKNVLKRPDHLKFIDLFQGITEEIWVDSIKWVSTKDSVLERDYAYDLAEIVAHAKDGQRAWYSAYTICLAKPILLNQPNFKEMITLIANANKEYQAKAIAYISKSPAFYMRENPFELVKDIVGTNDYYNILCKISDANIPIPGELPMPNRVRTKGALIKKINNN